MPGFVKYDLYLFAESLLTWSLIFPGDNFGVLASDFDF